MISHIGFPEAFLFLGWK